MRKLSMIAAAATLGLAAFAAAPASAQGWYGEGYGPGWHGGYGYGPYGRWGYDNWRARSGVVAVCPPGYALGPNGRLCWPQ